MKEQHQLNYDRIEEAIYYIQENYKAQPSLEDIAKRVHLSPYHFQKIFTEWAGVSPKKFVQYLSLNYAKTLLKEQDISIFDAAHKTGLSGTSRLHDLFIKIEGMSPGEFKKSGHQLQIHFTFVSSHFGNVLLGATSKGLCHVAFTEEKEQALADFRQLFPYAIFKQQLDPFHESALQILNGNWNRPQQIKLHIKGTTFQLKVWEALLKIPFGGLATYGQVARAIEKPGASRAVGTAIGNNPIAYLIPCHRVIRSSGEFGSYMWGPQRKKAIIGWEAAQMKAS